MGTFARVVKEIDKTIDDFGRDIILRQHTGTAVVDPAKPWLGVTQTDGDFTDTPVRMAFDPFRFDEMDGTLVKIGDVRAYVSTLSLGSVQPNVGDLIVEDTQLWRIVRVLHFKPNEESIAFELHATRC